MHSLLFFLSFLISIACFSQNDTTENRLTDTGVSETYRVYDSMQRQQAQDNNVRSFLALADLQKRQRAKEKRDAMLRIGIGVGFLAILVVGLRRRRKK